MPRLALLLKAELENVTNLRGSPDTRWYLKLRCSNCGDETKEFIYVVPEEKHPMPNSRGSANFIMSCKLCHRQNSVDVVDAAGVYTADQSGEFVPMLTLDCRGVEPVAWDPRVGLTCSSTESSQSWEVDLGEGDWTEYDENASVAVGIYNVEYRFNHAQK